MQLKLISECAGVQLPTTRYQGSKAKIADWLWNSLKQLNFDTVLDAFGGTGSVSYYLKARGKKVTFNDYLSWNSISAKGIIENTSAHVSAQDIQDVLTTYGSHPNYISEMFSGLFFLDEENLWIDNVAANIRRLPDTYQRALLYRALFQSCIIKRPYNLFHRANLYMRTANVERSFGNKATWDKPFESHFRDFVSEGNRLVFDSGRACCVLNMEALDLEPGYELVYLDPPYVNRAGLGINYLDFYHFLEGLADYRNWGNRIDLKKKHRPLRGAPSPWSTNKTVMSAFEALFRRHADSSIAISYRSDGSPSESELTALLKRYKKHVEVQHYGAYKYALSHNANSREILLIGHDT